jgi:hypothetical protein
MSSGFRDGHRLAGRPRPIPAIAPSAPQTCAPHRWLARARPDRPEHVCGQHQQFPESDKTQSLPRPPDGFFVNLHATIRRSWAHVGVVMRRVHVHCCSQRTPVSLRRCALRVGSKRLCRHPGCPPERDGHVVKRCAPVGVRPVFPHIACPARV